MSLHTQPSPSGGMSIHQAAPMAATQQVNGHGHGQPHSRQQILQQLNEAVWVSIGTLLALTTARRANRVPGSLTELMGDLDGAVFAYERAMRFNHYSIPAMNAISCIYRTREQFPKAVEYLQNILKLDPKQWGSVGQSRSLSSYDGQFARCLHFIPASALLLERPQRAEAVVRYRYPIRSLWLSRSCRRSFFAGNAHGAEFREGQRNLFPTWHNL